MLLCSYLLTLDQQGQRNSTGQIGEPRTEMPFAHYEGQCLGKLRAIVAEIKKNFTHRWTKFK